VSRKRRARKVPFLPLLLFPLFLFPEVNTEIYNLRHHIHPNFARVVLDMGQLREYNSGEWHAPDQIYIDIYEVKLNPILQGQTFPVRCDYLSQIRIAPKTSSSVRMLVDVDFAKIKYYRVYHLFDPFRIVLDIYPQEAPPPGATQKPAQPPQPTDKGYTLVRQLGLGIKTIIIDPGHGGEDPGCIGKGGLKEKNVVLDIALLLKKLFETRKDLEVILTRESDIFVPLENRTVIANQKKADLFISIHANANPNKKRVGIETFYLNFSPDPTVNEIAARENATSTKNISEMKEIIDKIVKNSKVLESRELADKIQKNLVKSLSQKYGTIKSLGVRGGPFWVLIGGEMPSVLVEVSHLSNPQEESRMKSPGHSEQVAQGIYEGILEYMHSLGKGYSP